MPCASGWYNLHLGRQSKNVWIHLPCSNLWTALERVQPKYELLEILKFMYEILKLEDELDCVKVKFFNLEKSIDDDKAYKQSDLEAIE